MPRKYTSLTFTDSVKATQAHFGARTSGEKVESWEVDDDHLSALEASFIAERDSFYMATVNQDGWPYLQHRGGPPGFLKVIDNQTLGFADYRGNRQYISAGNLRENDRVALLLMDYPNQRRLKLMVHTEAFDAAARPDLDLLQDESYSGRVERYVLFHIAAFDWNCPQHITPRFTATEWESKP